jgi:hypothetical protein
MQNSTQNSDKSNVKRKHTPLERAAHRRDLTLEIAEALSWAALGEDDAEMQAVSDLMIQAGQDENIFVAEGFDCVDEDTGETKFYDAFGSLNIVSSRCNPAYLKASSARARKRIKTALARVKPQSGEYLRYVVLTQPDMFGFDFDSAYQLLCGAVVRLKNHPFFKEKFRGGVFSDEFTLGAKSNKHFHLHTNILGYAKYIDFGELRRVWTDCLDYSARDMGKELEINTKDGYANVNIQQVKIAPKVEDEKREITLDNAIMETVKYVVKGSDFAKIPTEFICQVEKALYGKRLVETFGEANMRKGKGKKDNIGEISHLDKPRTIQDFTDAESSDSKGFVLERNDKRRETLRQKGKRLISEGRRDEWLRDLRLEFEKRREFRKKQLSERYKFAIFFTLAGEVWVGESVSPDRHKAFLETIAGNNHYQTA